MKRVTEVVGLLVLLLLSAATGLAIEKFADIPRNKWEGIPLLIGLLSIFVALVWFVVRVMSGHNRSRGSQTKVQEVENDKFETEFAAMIAFLVARRRAYARLERQAFTTTRHVAKFVHSKSTVGGLDTGRVRLPSKSNTLREGPQRRPRLPTPDKRFRAQA